MFYHFNLLTQFYCKVLTTMFYGAKMVYSNQKEVTIMRTLNFAAEYFYFSFFFNKKRLCFAAEN